MGARFCTQCGASCTVSDRFCAGCGHPLEALVVEAPSAPTDWGEVKPVTILFADIADSTLQIAALSPEQAMHQLRPAIQDMVRLVERHGGTVLRTLGDGIMAFFGLPVVLEHHAEAACHAALSLQVHFARHPGALAIRMGLHSGKVASDPTDVNDRRGGGAHGVAIHLASRVATLAEPGQILLTEATRGLLRHGHFTLGSEGAWHLKGIAQAVSLYSLSAEVGLGTEPATDGPFVGREVEMELLKQAFEQALQGNGQVLRLEGEAGMGKSRLCAELAQLAVAEGVRVTWVRTHPLGDAVPLQVVRHILGEMYLGLAPGAGPAWARSRIREALMQAGCRQDGDDALMFDLMGVAETGPNPEAQTRQNLRQTRLLALVQALVVHRSQVRLLVIVDDLHWLDQASRPLLAAMAAAVSGCHTMLLLNHRPGPDQEWLCQAQTAQLALDRLPAPALRTLIEHCLAEEPAPADLVRMPEEVIEQVARRSQGNPLFAQELTRHLLRAPASAGPVAGLPDSIDALIGARIDSLPKREKMLVQACSVVGQQAELGVLSRLVALGAGAFGAALTGLQVAGLLRPTSDAKDGVRLEFRHPLIQEVAYGMQLSSHRQALHGRLAQVLEARMDSTEPEGEQAALIAHHWEQAGQRLAAARQAARAARCLRTGDNQEVLRRWQKVMTLLEAETGTDEACGLRALAAGRIVYLGWRGGVDSRQLAGLIDEVNSQAGGADPRLPQLLKLAHARLRQGAGGSADDYVAALRGALAMPDPPGDAGRRATLHIALCQAYGWAGLLREALAANDVALAEIDRISVFDRDFIGFGVEQWALALRARALSRMGRLDEAQEVVVRMQAKAPEEPDAVMQRIFLATEFELAAARGEGDLAWKAARAMPGGGSPEHSYLRVTGAYFYALGAAAGHRHEIARSALTRALATVRQQQVAVDFEAEILVLLAETYAAMARWPEAVGAASETVAVARQRSNRVAECRGALVMARAGAMGADLGPALRDGDRDWLEVAGTLLDITGAEYWRPAWQALHAGP